MTPEEEAMFKDMGNDIPDLKHNLLQQTRHVNHVETELISQKKRIEKLQDRVKELESNNIRE